MKYSCQFSVSSFNLEDFEKVARKMKESFQVNSIPNLKLFGPIPMLRKEKLFTVNRSPHGNKKARDQFFLTSYKRVWFLSVEEQKDPLFYSKLLRLFNELSMMEGISFSWRISLKNR